MKKVDLKAWDLIKICGFVHASMRYMYTQITQSSVEGIVKDIASKMQIQICLINKKALKEWNQKCKYNHCIHFTPSCPKYPIPQDSTWPPSVMASMCLLPQAICRHFNG